MKSSKIWLALIVLLLVGGGLFFYKTKSQHDVQSSTGNVMKGDVQQLVISKKNLNYYPNEIKVKAEKPVSISLDSSVTGCLRFFTIKELGVSKYARTPQETIDFTPNKKGTFRFACSMGMGYGSLIVE